MIVTIDGPAGAGKSSVARAVAQRLGFRFLDTGAMYRAVVYAALQQHWPLDDPAEVARRTRHLSIHLSDGRILLNGTDVTDQLRTSQITEHIHYIADNAQVRAQMVELQRAEAQHADIVTEGRDQGSVVFPDAECKIFLTASPQERARRRLQDLAAAGESVTFDSVLRAQQDRDQRDQSRPVGALVQAPDAIIVVSDGLAREEVIERLVALVEQRRAERADKPEVTA